MPDDLPAVQRRVARHVVRLRRSRGLTQERLAELADISNKQLSMVERGEPNVKLGTLVAIARALSVNVADLTATFPRRRRPEPPLFLVNHRELEQLEQVGQQLAQVGQQLEQIVRSIRSARVTASEEPE